MHFRPGGRTGGLPSSIACLLLVCTMVNIELCESASSGNVLALLLPDPGTDTYLVNLTSGEGIYYKVVCPPIDPPSSHDKDTTISAIEMHVKNIQQARAHAAMGGEWPPFKAIFKSNMYQRRLLDLFELATFFTWSPVLEEDLPKFVCIRTEAEAQAYRSQIPNLWQSCTKPHPPSQISSGPQTSFLCPRFFTLPSDSEEPQQASCPAVRRNQFADNAQGEQFKHSKSSVITRFALQHYNPRIKNAPGAGGYVQTLNTIIGFGAAEAFYSTGSYTLFDLCGFNSAWNVILINELILIQ